MKAIMLSAIVALSLLTPSYAATANNNTQSACPEGCPACDSVLQARKAYISQAMETQKKTILKEDIVGAFVNCNDIMDLIMKPWYFTYTAPDVGLIIETLLVKVVNAVCQKLLNIAKGYINGILALFADMTQLPYGLGSVVTINDGNINIGIENPVIPTPAFAPPPRI